MDDVPIVTLAFSSTERDDFELRRIADEVVDNLQRVPNSSKSYVVGGRRRQVRVQLNPEAMTARGISPTDIVRALGGANVARRIGSSEEGNREILIEAVPHLGTDLLPGIAANLCERLVAQAGEITWHNRLQRLVVEDGRLRAIVTPRETIETNCLVLATGANARDTLRTLHDSGLAMEPKPFQMGFRVEHHLAKIGDRLEALK